MKSSSMLLPNTNLKQEHAAALALVATASALLYYLTRRTSDPLADFPIPKGSLPYIGHLACFDKLPGLKFRDWHDAYGPVLRVQMGVQPWIICSDQSIIHTLFNTHGAVASNRPFLTFPSHHYALGKRGIVLSDANKKWKHLRTAALSVLSPKNVEPFLPVLQSDADRLITDLIDATTKTGSAVDPLHLLQRTSLNYVLQTGFGLRIVSEKDPLFHDIIQFIDEGQAMGAPHNDLGGFLPMLSFIDTLLGRTKMFETFISTRRDPLFRQLIQRAAHAETDCLFQRLIRQQTELGLEEDDLLVAACDIILGGTDTTTATLSWIFAILLHHPETCRKLSAEVDAFIGAHGRLPSFTERESLPFLISVQKECMRYKPIGLFSFFHVLEKEIHCQGYLFPKGAWILPTVYAMHRNPEHFPEPDTFVPERFLSNIRTMQSAANGRIEERDHFVFGFGRRVCPGIHLAEVQMFTILTRVFAFCILEPPLNGSVPDLDDICEAGPTAIPAPYQARFVPRSDALLPF